MIYWLPQHRRFSSVAPRNGLYQQVRTYDPRVYESCFLRKGEIAVPYAQKEVQLEYPVVYKRGGDEVHLMDPQKFLLDPVKAVSARIPFHETRVRCAFVNKRSTDVRFFLGDSYKGPAVCAERFLVKNLGEIITVTHSGKVELSLIVTPRSIFPLTCYPKSVIIVDKYEDGLFTFGWRWTSPVRMTKRLSNGVCLEYNWDTRKVK